MSLDLPALEAAVAERGQVVRVLISRTSGSAPRAAGTSMLVWDGGQSGTIGGGALEYEAVAEAGRMIASGRDRFARTFPLGPALGQCCGGSVSLVWERFDAASLPPSLPYARPLTRLCSPGKIPTAIRQSLAGMLPGALPVEVDGWLIEAGSEPRKPLWIWGAGHVGRALVEVLRPFPDRAITWIDTAAERFPQPVPPNVTSIVASVPEVLVPPAPADADHLILTYSHDHDLSLCHALLHHRFASVGLIGSATKWARFRSRLRDLGHGPEAIARIACPIGDPGLGKHPQAIAVGVAAALLKTDGRVMTLGEKAG